MRVCRYAIALLALTGWIAFELATDSMGVFVSAQAFSYLSFEQITVAASALGFTSDLSRSDRARVAGHPSHCGWRYRLG
jgi:hypothetical protein